MLKAGCTNQLQGNRTIRTLGFSLSIRVLRWLKMISGGTHARTMRPTAGEPHCRAPCSCTAEQRRWLRDSPSEVNSIWRNPARLASVFSTFMLARRLPTVLMLSSAARMPRPEATSFRAVATNPSMLLTEGQMSLHNAHEMCNGGEAMARNTM